MRDKQHMAREFRVPGHRRWGAVFQTVFLLGPNAGGLALLCVGRARPHVWEGRGGGGGRGVIESPQRHERIRGPFPCTIRMAMVHGHNPQSPDTAAEPNRLSLTG